jgi:predicted DNA-binding transcriptional regulator AlpA
MDSDTTTDADIELITLDEVKRITGLCTTQIYVDPNFPQGVKLARKATRWIKAEVLAWVRSKIAVRDAAAVARRQQLTDNLARRRGKQRLTPSTVGTGRPRGRPRKSDTERASPAAASASGE